MVISQTAEYALRAVIHLAEHFGVARTTQQIAGETHVPADYLSKVLKLLVNAKLVSSQRGLYGGFRLLRDPSELTVIEVVEVVGTLQRYHECPLNREHASGSLCPLHQLLDDSMAQIEASFRKMTIRELIETDGDDSGLCQKPERLSTLHIQDDAKTHGNENGPRDSPDSPGSPDPPPESSPLVETVRSPSESLKQDEEETKTE